MYVPGGSIAAGTALAPPLVWPGLGAREHAASARTALATTVTRNREDDRDIPPIVASPAWRLLAKRGMVNAAPMGKKLELAIAILNGAVGDRLARTDNGLATPMELIFGGRELPVVRAELARAHPEATSRIAIFVHGLMCTEDVWTLPDGTDYGSLLARDHGFTPLYLRYNSGLTIAKNGVAFARLLDRLVAEYPVAIDEIVPIGFSMGGLVVRSACHVASLAPEAHPWLPLVKRAIYVGTPHLGAPMERVGRVVSKLLRAVDDPYTQLAAELADLRSDGVKDLGDADIRDEDRARREPRIGLRDPRHPVPLLPQIQHYLVAGSLSTDARLASVFGDSIVPVRSATDGECVDAATFALPPGHVKIVSGLAHITLPHHPAVYEHVRAWCGPDALEGKAT